MDNERDSSILALQHYRSAAAKSASQCTPAKLVMKSTRSARRHQSTRRAPTSLIPIPNATLSGIFHPPFLFSCAGASRTRDVQPDQQDDEPPSQRTVMPERFVYILAAMFMLASSWNSSFAAYGICTCATLVLLRHGLHSNCCFLRFLPSR